MDANSASDTSGSAGASSTEDRERRVENPQRSLDAPGPNVGSGGGGRNNVVVKVGMVGDAQVGKTSLMVKYVEGKFDEDYIHTLGTYDTVNTMYSWMYVHVYSLVLIGRSLFVTQCRRELHGEDDRAAQHRDHIQHLGPGW